MARTEESREHRAIARALTDADKPQSAPWNEMSGYERWASEQGIPVVGGFHLASVMNVPTRPWPHLGVDAALVELDGAASDNGAYVLRVRAGVRSREVTHCFEEVVYVLRGAGRTRATMNGKLLTCGWSAGDLFALPVNCPYSHEATADALLYCVHTATPTLNIFHDEAFALSNPFSFGHRWTGREDSYFSPEGKLWRTVRGRLVWESNVVRDVPRLPIPENPARGGRNLHFQFGDSALSAHVSEFPVGTYKKAHRHGPGAHVILLEGDGYSLLWKDDFRDRQEVRWSPGAILVPPDRWWHQHFNTGATPARYIAVHLASQKHPARKGTGRALQDRRAGGDQIEYDDQDPLIQELFDQARAS